jgi:hypothetical protein
MNDNTVNFLKNGTIDGLNYGVEIEFSDAGNLLNEGSPAYDEDAAESCLNENAEDWVQNHLGCGHQVAREMLRHGSLEDFVNGFTRYSWSDMVSEEMAPMNENNENNEAGYEDVMGWDHEEDGTRGIVQEYQSHVGNLETTCMRVASLMAEAGNRRRVPLNGSCHIHVSVPGSRHSATDQSLLHCCLIFELSQQIDLFPSIVRERMDDIGAQIYFRTSALPTTKFSAVHIHQQGTWEFRIFGGMREKSDIETCLGIAGRTFLAGYRRFLAGEFVISDPSEFRQRFADAMAIGVPMMMTEPALFPNEVESSVV